MQALAVIPDLNKVKYYPSKIVIIIAGRFYGEFCFKGFNPPAGGRLERYPSNCLCGSCFGGPVVGRPTVCETPRRHIGYHGQNGKLIPG